MSAGDLITADYQVELRGMLLGPSTRFSWSGPWVGLGLPAVKTNDVTLDQGDGDFPGRDYLTSRILTFPAQWGGTTAADAMADLSLLSAAWAPASTEQIELHAQLPGWGHFYVIGRPRGLVEDLTNLKSGEGDALLTFAALDPTVVFVPPPGP